MLDQAHVTVERGSSKGVDPYDLVVIGAGIAGLNALYAAVSYLPQGARVLLLDQKQAAGGMWNTAYDYVRLHQPHPMFTVGDLKWNWDKPPSYLATRDEVREHLACSLTPVGEKIDLLKLFGFTASSCREVATDQSYCAEVTFHPNEKTGQSRTVLARRAIYASGLDYQEAEPLTGC
jgi:hypothetical protein